MFNIIKTLNKILINRINNKIKTKKYKLNKISILIDIIILI